MVNDCIKCHRRVVFHEGPCNIHPGFKTEQEKKQEEENKKLKEMDDNIKVIIYVAGLRTYGAFGKESEFNLLWLKLCTHDKHLMERVTKEIENKGPMSDEEMRQTIGMALHMLMNRR